MEYYTQNDYGIKHIYENKTIAIEESNQDKAHIVSDRGVRSDDNNDGHPSTAINDTTKQNNAMSNRQRCGYDQKRVAIRMDSKKVNLDDLQAEMKQKFMQYMEASKKYSDEYEIITTMRQTKDMTTESPLFGTVYAEVTDLLPSGRPGGGSSPIWDKAQDPRVTIRVDGKAAIEETVKTLTLLRDGISKALEWYQDKTINDNNRNYSETFTTNDGGAVKTVQVASSSDYFRKYIYPEELPTVDNNGRDKDLYSDKKLERKRKAQNQGECCETKRLGGDNENSTDANEGQKEYELRSNNCPSKKAKKDNSNTPFQNGQNNCGSEGCPGSTDTKTACCHCGNRIHRNE
jgi:hypothetical protein